MKRFLIGVVCLSLLQFGLPLKSSAAVSRHSSHGHLVHPRGQIHFNEDQSAGKQTDETCLSACRCRG